MSNLVAEVRRRYQELFNQKYGHFDDSSATTPSPKSNFSVVRDRSGAAWITNADGLYWKGEPH